MRSVATAERGRIANDASRAGGGISSAPRVKRFSGQAGLLRCAAAPVPSASVLVAPVVMLHVRMAGPARRRPHGVDPHGVGRHRVGPRCDACAIAVRMSPEGSAKGGQQAGQGVWRRAGADPRTGDIDAGQRHRPFFIYGRLWGLEPQRPLAWLARREPPASTIDVDQRIAVLVFVGDTAKVDARITIGQVRKRNRQCLVEAVVPGAVDLDAMPRLLRKQCLQFGPHRFGGRGPIGKNEVALPGAKRGTICRLA